MTSPCSKHWKHESNGLIHLCLYFSCQFPSSVLLGHGEGEGGGVEDRSPFDSLSHCSQKDPKETKDRHKNYMLNVHTEYEKALIMFDYILNYWYPVLCYKKFSNS